MIEAAGLSKRFLSERHTFALRDVSFHLPKGEVLGVLGATGAGKTTLLRLLAGLLLPTTGVARIGPYDASTDWFFVKDRIGFVPQVPALPTAMSLLKYLDYWGWVGGMAKRERKARIEDLLARLELADIASQRILEATTYAHRRLVLGVALLHDPDILLLDEPMGGLSPGERDAFLGKLMDLADGRTTTILASTKLADLSPIGSQIMALVAGRSTRPLRIQSALRAIGEGHHARAFLQASAPYAQVGPLLRDIPGILEIRNLDNAIALFVEPGKFRAEEVRRVLGEAGIAVHSLKEAEVIIGDVVRALRREEAA